MLNDNNILKVMCSNVDGLKGNMKKLDFKDHVGDTDIVVILETKLIERDKISIVQPIGGT